MFIRTLLQPTFRLLLAGSILSLGLFTFGNAEYFDRIYLVVIILLIFLFNREKYRDIDMLGTLSILLAWCVIDELFYFSVEFSFSKATSYLITCAYLYKSREDGFVRKFVIPFCFFTILAEFYWIYTEYKAPLIHYYISLMLVNLIARDLFSLRFFYTIKYLKVHARILDIDKTLKYLCTFNISFIALMISEYLVRHLTDLNSMVIYGLYPFIEHSLVVVTAFVLIDYIYKDKAIIKA